MPKRLKEILRRIIIIAEILAATTFWIGFAILFSAVFAMLVIIETFFSKPALIIKCAWYDVQYDIPMKVTRDREIADFDTKKVPADLHFIWVEIPQNILSH